MQTHFFSKTLELETRIIGYPSMGESIIIFIYLDNIIRYTLVIDSFEAKNTHATVQLLNEKNVTLIDGLVWTHPDQDHTKGFEKYIPFIKKETKVFIPPDIQSTKNSYIQLKNQYPQWISFLDQQFVCRQNASTKIKIKTLSAGHLFEKKQYISMVNSHKYDLEIFAVSPDTSTTMRGSWANNLTKPNLHSIGLVFILGDHTIFLGSDIENSMFSSVIETLELFNKSPLCVDIIKLPHHGSKGSNNLISCLSTERKVPIALTTVYKSGNLPNLSVLNYYCENVVDTMFCTNDLEVQTQQHDYGILTVKTEISSPQKKYDVYPEGNAAKYNPYFG